MFEHTSILSSKGHYETTASHLQAVRDRRIPDREAIPGEADTEEPRDPRAERLEIVRKATIQRLWDERRRNRRQRTAS